MSGATNHHAAETRLRELLTESALPQPDTVEYTAGSVIFLWHEPRTAVIVDLEDGEVGPERDD